VLHKEFGMSITTRNRTVRLLTLLFSVMTLAPGAAVNESLVAESCVRSHGYWKNHVAEWPVASQILGDPAFAGHTYQQHELVSLLNGPAQGDASVILAMQLIAAKLNVANGASAEPIAGWLTRADALLAGFRQRLPYRVQSNTPIGSDMLIVASVLEQFNVGTIAGSCGSANTAPVANAGPAQSVPVGVSVTLDGSASSDADGQALAFRWAFVSTPSTSTAVLSDAAAVRPTFVADVAGSYDVQLIVSDGTVDSTPSVVRISTINSAPTANAGLDQTAPVGASISLSGAASTDPDGDSLAFAWSMAERPDGSSADLVNPQAVAPSFTIDRPGQYRIELLVFDGALSSAPDSVTISTINSPPVARAGADTAATVGSDIILDGSASTDVDGDALTYRWTLTSRPASSTTTLTNSTAVNPSFVADLAGDYVVELIVNDGTADSAPDVVIVNTSRGNTAPVAHAGLNQMAITGDVVQLDGSGSTDVDGDPLTFAWSFTSLPAGSAAGLSDPAAVQPTFTPDLSGTYVAQLIVSDPSTASAASTVTITVTPRPPDNQAPIAEAGVAQTVPLNTVAQLDGSGSSDPDGDALTYAWSLLSRPAGSAAILSDPTAVGPSFTLDTHGAYVAQLIVNDGSVNSAADTVTISTQNSPPVADAGDDASVALGATVQLDGSGSFDADGSALTYAWSLTRPAGSNAVLSSTSTVNPTFVADVNGTFVAQLIVSDGVLASAPDTAAIGAGPGADIGLTFFRAPSNPPVGESSDWGITAHNHGSVSPVEVQVSVPVPAGYTFVSASTTQGSYDPATALWTIPALSQSAGVHLFLALRPNATGPYTITVEVISSTAPDPNPSNNKLTTTPTPDPTMNLGLSYFNFSPGTRSVGEEIFIIMDVQNSGPAAASDAAVDFKIPAGFTVISFDVSRGSYDPTSGLWNLGSFARSGFARSSIRMRLNATGSIVLRAIATSTSPDSDPANNILEIARMNRAPVAIAGADHAISTHTAVTLDGSASFDADGDPITYEWTTTLRPINSAATLSTLIAPSPSLTPDLPGTYRAQLVVRDSFGVASVADSAVVTAVTTNRAPLFVTTPARAALIEQPYTYDADAIDPDAGDELTFSLATSPAGMTIDGSTGVISWTPAADQAGQQNVVLRVQDAGGLFATQAVSLQVASPGNGAPLAVDDSYNVRVSESLSVNAPGVAANDTDESALTTRLVTSPSNGVAVLNADGSFTYTPHTMQPGEFVMAENVNLAARIKGVTEVRLDVNCPRCAIDEKLQTEWISGGAPLEIIFPAAVTVNHVAIVGSRNQNAHKISAGIFELIAGDGTVLYGSGPVEILGPHFDATLTLPSLQGVRRVRFTPTASPTFLFAASLAELRVVGSGLIKREPFVEPNLLQLLPVTVRSNGFISLHVPESVADDNPQTNWYTGATPGNFIEVSFPVPVTIRQLIGANPNGRPDGFGTSNGLVCNGTFTLLDANGVVLHDSGLVNEPTGFHHPSDTFTVTFPEVADVRHLRYTLSNCTAGFGLGFADWQVLGSAPVTTLALGMSQKLQSLQGREAHSTPIVINLSDDNGDGSIDTGDIPDIAIAVEAVDDQLRGEIKVISGDDGRLLFTAGGPNLVSPWSELAAGDIDADGRPEILAVSASGNRLLAFEHDGTLKWESALNTMPSFFIGASQVITGAISIANLDGIGPPEIIVGASVFDADGQLLGDGRSLGGTTGGTGLRSAISAVADIDLDGAPELVAGPTAYRLSSGSLTAVWRRTDRADGYVAIANLDDDPQAEIVSVANGVVYALNHDGSDFLEWNAPTNAPVEIPGGGQGGAPLVVDVDGDGRPEIGVAGASNFVLFNRDGRVRWQAAISDRSSNSTGAVAFDLNGDGEVEIIYRDERFLRIYRGADGVLLVRTPVGSATWAEEPVVADVDNDGHADIVVSSDLFLQSAGDTGILVFQDVANRWARTRRIWNQHVYHVTNVNEDATIPVNESAHWLTGGLNSFRTNAFVPGESADETDSFTYVASDGVLESNTATVRILVRDPNAPPQFTSAAVTHGASGVAYAYAAQASDPDAADILTYSLPTAPIGMSIDGASGLIQWTPDTAQAGIHSVVVKVADVRGLYALQGFSIEVGAPIDVPNVVGFLQSAADAAIVTAGLSVGAISMRPSASVAAGHVISQSPAGGSTAASLASVSLAVSTGPPPVGVVPDVIGLIQPAAQSDITAAGLVPVIDARNNSTVPAGIVFGQSPAGGVTAAANSPVTIVVSLGPPPGELDLDLDGFTGDHGDCNDTNPAINPAAFDVPGDGIDQNCNGVDSIAGDNTLPIATITSPDDLAEITVPTDIIGTATDANFLRYSLTVAEVDSTTTIAIGSGTAGVSNGVVGRLDPTLMENGLYRVRLVVEDINGQQTFAERVYRVDGQAKVGNFRISFVDLSVPVIGIPISAVRTYDSRVKSQEDFGIGWTLDIARGTYRHNRTPGRGWIIRDQPFLGEFLPCIGGTAETLSHLTEVRLSDRESYTFALEITNGNLGITGACEGIASFRAVDGTRPGATLEILDGTDVIYLRGGDDSVLDLNAFLDGTTKVFDPQRVRLTTIDGTRIELARRGGITLIEDRNGNSLSITANGIVHSTGTSITFARDSQNRITAITDPMGNQLQYRYDTKGDLVEFIDAAGNRTTFNYDVAHNLLEILDPLGNRAGRNEYDEEGRLIAVVDASGNRVALTHDLQARREVVTDRMGGTTVMEYDERGNVVRRVDPLGHQTLYTYDARDNVLTETDALGNARTFTYDASSNKLTETDALGNTTAYTYNALAQELTRTDPRGGVTRRTYDAKGNLRSETDPEGGFTRYTVDARGQLVSVTDAAGAVRKFAYDNLGREISATDPLGNIIQRTYDASGRLATETGSRVVNGSIQILTTRYLWDARGLLAGVVDPEGVVTTTAYAASGRPLTMTDPLGRSTRLIYDQLGRQVGIEHPDGTSEQYEYDAEGRRTSTVDAAGRRITQTYDAAGRVVAARHADNTTRTASYDAAGRITSSTDENGHTVTVAYDATGRPTAATNAVGATETSSYDANGNLVSRRDRNGNVTTYTYDLTSRLTSTTYANGTSVSQEFDDAGRLASRTDQEGNRTHYEYNLRGDLVAVVDALGNRTTYEYDALGNRAAMTDAGGRTTRYAYDHARRLLTTRLPLGQTASHAYDAAGNLVSTLDFNGDVTLFGYDLRNRLTRRTMPASESHEFRYTATGRVAATVDSRGTTTFEYDLRDRPTLVRHPDGAEIRYGYDAVGNRASIATAAGTTRFVYDAANQMTAVADAAGHEISVAYNPLGKPTRVEYPGGLTTDFGYDSLNRLVGVTHSRDGATVASYSYTLGLRGERVQVSEHSGRQVAYTYDAAGRLTREAVTSGGATTATDYTYDAVGNRLSKAGAAGLLAYSYDNNSRLAAAGPVTFTYDANGNLIGRAAGGANTAYNYDVLGRLRQVTTPGGAVTRYTYDAFNQRVQRISPAGTTNFVVDAVHPSGLPQILLEADETGQATAAYVHAGAVPISQDRGGQTSFLLTDGQSSTRLLADSTGAITDTFDFDAFGLLAGRTGTTENSHQFNGQEFDADSGFYHLRAREYDPQTGRFTSVDPFGGFQQDPVSLHPYLYAQNDPINRSDPSGEVTLVEAMFVANAVFTVATTAYDLYQGNYKSAAVNVALGVVPFGSLFKAVFRGGRALARGVGQIDNLAPGAVTEIQNLAPGAVTEIANLSSTAVTDIARIGDDISVAVAALPEAPFTTLADRAIRAGGSLEVTNLLLSQTAEIRTMYDAAKRLYLQGFSSASDFVPFFRKTVGQPGWQAKLCALASAHYVFTGQTSNFSFFAALVQVGVNLTLQGSGYRCSALG
jgi:RHS repeat-associated protein/uncharacterized repeat protein (TIGR01451 family)